MINFSKLLDSSNFDLDIRKIESCMSIEKDEQNNILITDESNKNEAPEQLDFNSHKDYLIGKLCQKLRKVNKENRNLNKRVEKLENQHFELVKSHDQTFEKLETEIGSIVKENLSMKLDNPKELTQIKEVIILENPKEIEVKSEEKKNFSQKQERFQTERTETYEDLLYKIKTLENDRNRYYEQLMTVQKKNEIFFIENSELSKKNQKILADNDDLASKLRFFETSIKKKSSLIFKSASINESTIETDDEMLKYSSLPPNEAIVKEVFELIFCLYFFKNFSRFLY